MYTMVLIQQACPPSPLTLLPARRSQARSPPPPGQAPGPGPPAQAWPGTGQAASGGQGAQWRREAGSGVPAQADGAPAGGLCGGLS